MGRGGGTVAAGSTSADLVAVMAASSALPCSVTSIICVHVREYGRGEAAPAAVTATGGGRRAH